MCSLVPPARALVADASATVTRGISEALARFGEGAIAFAHARGIRIVPLSAAQRYRDASAALRRLGADVDAWPVPPAGLFGDISYTQHDKRVTTHKCDFHRT